MDLTMECCQKQEFCREMFLAEAGAGKTMTAFGERRVIFMQGDPANAIFYIEKGKVKLTVVSKKGKEAVIAMLGAGDFFGEGCLAGQQVRMSTATAMTDCGIMRLEKATAVEVLHQAPAFSALLLSHVLTRTTRMEEDLVDQLFNSTEKRLARTLLLLANVGNDGKPETVIRRMSQQTLAEMIGTTRSRVSFFMNKFRKLGFIEYKDTIQVRASLLNVVQRD